MKFYEFNGRTYPEYLRQGNAMQYIRPFAEKWCVGRGLDVGCGKYILPGAIGIDPNRTADKVHHAMNLPEGEYDYIFSSHCLEHLDDGFEVLKYWTGFIKKGGILFLYLPHPFNEEWLPEHTKGHKRLYYPYEILDMMKELGYHNIISADMDLLWSFSMVGVK